MFPYALPARAGLLAAVAALPLLAACTPQDRYDQSITANRSLREQVDMLQRENRQLETDLTSIRDLYSTSEASRARLQGDVSTLESAVGDMDAATDATLRRIAALELGPLPESIENAVKDLALAHPELLTFDPQRGLLRFSSDFSFDTGSDALKPDATATLTRLAGILNEPDADRIEVHVIGHTDNMPIGKPETRRRHPTNWHLSVHRAISVARSLSSSGLDPSRIEVAGHGEHRPMVANGKRGAVENRRVEIFLAPLSTAQTASAMPPKDGPPAASAGALAEEPMK